MQKHRKSFLKDLKLLDYLIVPGLLFVTLWLFINETLLSPAGSRLIIQSPTIRMEYRMDNDREVVVDGALGESIIVIQEGKAYFKESPCPNKYCIKMGEIHRVHSAAACVPNEVYIYVEGEEQPTNENLPVDAISR